MGAGRKRRWALAARAPQRARSGLDRVSDTVPDTWETRSRQGGGVHATHRSRVLGWTIMAVGNRRTISCARPRGRRRGRACERQVRNCSEGSWRTSSCSSCVLRARSSPPAPGRLSSTPRTTLSVDVLTAAANAAMTWSRRHAGSWARAGCARFHPHGQPEDGTRAATKLCVAFGTAAYRHPAAAATLRAPGAAPEQRPAAAEGAAPPRPARPHCPGARSPPARPHTAARGSRRRRRSARPPGA